MVLIALGAFNVSVKYLFKPKGRLTWHYRRHVPSSVKNHYDQPHILKSLQTEDDVEADLDSILKEKLTAADDTPLEDEEDGVVVDDKTDGM